MRKILTARAPKMTQAERRNVDPRWRNYAEGDPMQSKHIVPTNRTRINLPHQRGMVTYKSNEYLSQCETLVRATYEAYLREAAERLEAKMKGLNPPKKTFFMVPTRDRQHLILHTPKFILQWHVDQQGKVHKVRISPRNIRAEI